MAYTTIDDPSAYFQTLLYTGNGSARSLTNDGNSNLQPDWVWTKKRNAAQNHCVTDSSRGVGNILFPDVADQESATQLLTSFDSDGFSINTNALVNQNTHTYVAWQWKANGGTTASNSDGSLTSTVQASTTSGFSIVTYTGNASQGATIGHGLGAVPNVVLVKGRSVGDSWTMLHSGIASDFQTDMIKLDETGAAQDNSVFWNDTAPTSSVFSVDGAGGESKVNESGKTYVAYCFTPIQGYSKFGSYTGNGGSQFVYTGFAPAFLIEKRSSNSGTWTMYDNKRSPFNERSEVLHPESNAAEETYASAPDFLSNGFAPRGAVNDNGETVIYLAFAEHPFVSSEGVPTTAR